VKAQHLPADKASSLLCTSPVDDFLAGISSTSVGTEETLACVGHLPAEGREQVPSRNEGVGLGTSGQGDQCAVAAHEQLSTNPPCQMKGPKSVDVSKEDHQPAEGCNFVRYTGEGLNDILFVAGVQVYAVKMQHQGTLI